MDPRIYVYKITFEETPDWYWGVHKELRFNEFYMGSPVTNAWKWEFYTPKKQIVQFFEYSDKGFKKARELEDRLILPDLHNPLCLNESVGGRYSLTSCSLGGKTASELLHSKKDEKGRSVQAVAGGQASSKIWTDAKIESSKRTIKIATQTQKDRKIQIYGDDWEYYRRKGRLTRYGVKIDGIRVPANRLSETFVEYHLRYGQQRGGYRNPV